MREARPTVGVTSFQGPPKSDAGRRILELAPDLVRLLQAHHDAQADRERLMDTLWVKTDLVCTDDHGDCIEYSNLTRSFKRLRKRAKVSDIRLYDLRHTAITLMAASGADLKAVSEVAGHANVMITRNIYQHINRKQRRAALDALTYTLGEPEDSPTEALSNG